MSNSPQMSWWLWSVLSRNNLKSVSKFLKKCGHDQSLHTIDPLIMPNNISTGKVKNG